MRALTSAARAIKAELERALQDQGVHAGQHLILEALWEEEEGLTPGELADRCGVAVPTITRGVQRMEATGLLARRPMKPTLVSSASP